MSPNQTADVLSVSLGDVLVGQLTRTGEGATFALDDDYLRSPERPVLGQMFEDNPRADHHVRHGVPAWFSNLLPEGALRDLIAQRAGVHSSRSWFLLELLGLDLPGAVVIRREGAPPELAEPERGESAAADDQLLKFSLAGVQLKFSALRGDRGLTIPAGGRGGDWIVKLPDQRFEQVPENEYSVMNWARSAGIDVPETLLIDVADIVGLPAQLYAIGGVAFAVRRFDRTVESRIHIEDFAQVLGLTPQEKYGHANFESIARVLAAIAPQDVDQMVRRLVFQVLAGNGDAHVKNWSLIYPDLVHARLSPSYDLINTTSYVPNDDLGLNLGRVKTFDRINVGTFRRFAKRAGLESDSVEAVVVDQTQRTLEAWEQAAEDFVGPIVAKTEIEQRLNDLPLARGEAAG